MKNFLNCNYPSCIESHEDKPECTKCKVFQHNIELDIHWKPVSQPKRIQKHKIRCNNVFSKMCRASSLIKKM